MNTQLLSALIGAVVGGLITVTGWFINYSLSRRKEDETRRKQAAQHHLERQIEELYGPLWSLIQQSKAVYNVACQRLPAGPSGRPDPGRFGGQDTQIWHYFVETYFLPINAQIAELIRSKVYLLESGQVPASFQDYMQHQAQFHVLHHLWKDKQVDSSNVTGGGWPAQFNVDVEQALDRLMKQYQGNLE